MPFDSVRNVLDDASAYTLAVNIPYALAFVAVTSEVIWISSRGGEARRTIFRSFATAAGMGLGALLVGVLYTAVLKYLWETVAVYRWEGLAHLWSDHPVLGAIVAFVAWDFSGWLYHSIGHRTRIGWAAHQPHHTGVDFDATLGFRQSWAPFHGLAHHPLLALLGFDIRVIIICAAISNCWQVLEHTSVPVRIPRWLSTVVMTPGAHRHHHGTEGGLVNIGPFFTIWDRLSGTWKPEDLPAPASYGIKGVTSSNPVFIELMGWKKLFSLPPTKPAVRHREAQLPAGLHGRRS